MVLASKLSHLASSFRPQHHLHQLKHAFNNSSSSSAAASGGSAASSGGSSGWHAGSRAGGWAYQSHGRLVTQAPSSASTDPSAKASDDENEGAQAPGSSSSRLSNSNSRAHARQQQQYHARLTRAPWLAAASSASSAAPVLVLAEEAGLSGVRLLAQKRWRHALSLAHHHQQQPQQTSQDDFAIVPSSSSSSTLPASATSTHSRMTTTTSRALHTHAVESPSSPPPPDLPRVRRNSISAIQQHVSGPSSSSSMPSRGRPLRAHRSPPPTSAAAERPQQQQQQRRRRTGSPTQALHALSPSARQAYAELMDARKTGDAQTAENAVRAYLAKTPARAHYSVAAHNLALRALALHRRPYAPIANIVKVYNMMFDPQLGLEPSLATFELVIGVLLERHKETAQWIQFLELRQSKRELALRASARRNTGADAAAAAAAPDASASSSPVVPQDAEKLAQLRKDDYLAPALEIYHALGPQADSLSLATKNNLLHAAAKEGRVELALALFARLEQAAVPPNHKSYRILIKLYGHQRDAGAVRAVYDAYLAKRQSGALDNISGAHFSSLARREGSMDRRRSSSSSSSAAASDDERHVAAAMQSSTNAGSSVANDAVVDDADLFAHKHGYSVAPPPMFMHPIHRGGQGHVPASSDSQVFAELLRALFAAGDAAGALEYVDRVVKRSEGEIEAQSQAGLPSEMEDSFIEQVVCGFLEQPKRSSDHGEDDDSAAASMRWLDQGELAREPWARSLRSRRTPGYYTSILYTALRHDKYDALRHVFRTAARRSLKERRPLFKVSEFIAVIDASLAELNAAAAAAAAAATTTTTTSKQARLVADVKEHYDIFCQMAAASLVQGIPPTFRPSRGLQTRVIAALGRHGAELAPAAAEMLASLAAQLDADGTFVTGPNADGYLASLIYISAAEALGIELESPGYYESRGSLPPRDKRHGLAPVLTVLNGLAPLLARRDVAMPRLYASYLVEEYLDAKSAKHGDVSALALSRQDWLTVVHSFAVIFRAAEDASAARLIPKGFDGFEAVIDDFASSGTPSLELSAQMARKLLGLLGGGLMPRERIGGVFAALDDRFAHALRTGQTDVFTMLRNIAEGAPAPERHGRSDFAHQRQHALSEPGRQPQVERPAEVQHQQPTRQERQQRGRAKPSRSVTPQPAQVLAPLSTPMDYASAAVTFAGDAELLEGHSFERMIAIGQAKEAARQLLHHATTGRLAHSDVYSRCVEALGRDEARLGGGSASRAVVETCRSLYMAGNDALRFITEPSDRYTSWVLLEDRLLIALAYLRSFNDVQLHYNRLLENRNAPSAEGYAAMILNMNRTTDDAAVAVELFEQSQRFGVKPSTFLFNTLISKLSHARRAQDALQYFELMKQFNLQPSYVTYGAIITACMKTADDLSAEYLFKEMMRSPAFKPHVPPFNAMIQLYAQMKPDRERALYFYQILRERKIQPTSHTYKLLLDVYGSVGEPDTKALMDTFQQLQIDAHRHPKVVQVKGEHWASLIHSYGAVQRDLPRAMSIFTSVASHPSTPRVGGKPALPDAIVYEAMLNTVLANDRGDLCEQYLDDMKAKGVRMTAYVANTLIKGYTSQGKIESARKVFDTLQDPPPGFAAINNHAALSNKAEPRPAHPSMASDETHVYREPSTWETMIRAELDMNQFDRAADLLQRAERRAFPEAIIKRLRYMLQDVGVEMLAHATPMSDTPTLSSYGASAPSSSSPRTPSPSPS